jgi:hypothetical protein
LELNSVFYLLRQLIFKELKKLRNSFSKHLLAKSKGNVFKWGCIRFQVQKCDSDRREELHFCHPIFHQATKIIQIIA